MYMLLEQSDVFVDAMASDHHGQLLFISLFGRDTSVQQFLARLHLPSREGGVSELSAVERFGDRPALRVLVGDPRRLDKATGRLPRTGLFGNVVHAWIFDPCVLAADHASRSAWIVAASELPDQDDDELWRLVAELSPVPLLDGWRDAVIDHVRRSSGLANAGCIGRIHAQRVELQADFPDWISAGVRSGLLASPPSARV